MHPELFTIPGLGMPIRSYGAMVVLAFLIGVWWMVVRARKIKADPDVALDLGFIALLFGWAGARLFHAMHYWNQYYAENPWRVLNPKTGGFEIYGGLITAAVVSVLYLRFKKVSFRVYADLAVPSLALGMGIGRIGCFLHGCCWGGPCPAELPWAVHFPYGSPPHMREWDERRATLPAELIFIDSMGSASPMMKQLHMPSSLEKLDNNRAKLEAKIEQKRAEGKTEEVERMEKALAVADEYVIVPLKSHYARFKTTPEKLRALTASPGHGSTALHPVQLYAAIGPILLALLLSAYFYRRERHGTVFALALMLYAIERFAEEMIRIDNPHDTAGLTVSQGVSVAVFLLGVLSWLAIRQMPLHSTAALVPASSASSDAGGGSERAGHAVDNHPEGT